MGTTRERKVSTVRKQSCKRHSPRECRFLFIILLIITAVFKLMINRTDRSYVKCPTVKLKTTSIMKDWDRFYCNHFDCVFYDQDTDICDFCSENFKPAKE